jgi:proline racemase
MRQARFVDMIYTHTEGEPTGIIHAGIPYPAGGSILDKRRFLEREYDWLRRAVMREPRGHRDMFGVFLTPPSQPGFDAGMIWIDGENFMHMCGHGTIGLSIAMVAQGMAPPGATRGDVTTIRFETTAGPVTAAVEAVDGRAATCAFENVPAFVVAQEVPFDLPGYGRLTADISFGGNFFAQIEWTAPAVPIRPENAAELSRAGLLARRILMDKVKVAHPVETHITDLTFLTFWQAPTNPAALYRCVHVFSDGKLDRSPGGTGTSAMLALFERRGRLKVGDTVQSEGLLGSGTFEGTLLRTARVGPYAAIVPRIKGKAHLTGFAKWLIDPHDPLAEGFVVG